MSTRCNVLVKYESGHEVQFYHHQDGYPEGVGYQLKSFLDTTSTMYGLRSTSDFFYNLLKAEGKYELEDKKVRHVDIDYVYYVDMKKDLVTYTEVDQKILDKIYSIQDDSEHELALTDYFDSLFTVSEGEREIKSSYSH